jgi:beta-xylosidase
MKPITRFVMALLFAACFPVCVQAQRIYTGGGNPILDGADPDITIVGNTYWMYPTHLNGFQEALFFAYASTDLKTWTRHGPLLDLKDVRWIGDDHATKHFAWAPGIFQKNGQFYLYFSVGPQTPTASRIGVAVASAPQGPFVDSGKPLLTGGNGFEAIDAMVFEDPQSGKVYLYCGGSAGAKLRVFELHADLISIAREFPVATPEKFTEGSFMHVRDGLYYFSYSHGRWNDATYSVHYSTAPSPTGPWTYKGCILQSNDEHWGPGHHAIVRNPASGEWFIVYHRWNGAGTTGKMPRGRSVCIDRLQYDKQGNILPITMTNEGVLPAPISNIQPKQAAVETRDQPRQSL